MISQRNDRNRIHQKSMKVPTLILKQKVCSQTKKSLKVPTLILKQKVCSVTICNLHSAIQVENKNKIMCAIS